MGPSKRPENQERKPAKGDALTDWKDHMEYPYMRTTDPYTRVEATAKMMSRTRQRAPWAVWILRLFGLAMLGGILWIGLGGFLGR